MSINYNMIYSPLIMESVSHPEGNEDAFLKLGEIDVYDNNLKSIITVKTEDFVKVVTDAMFKISNEYKFFYHYLKYSKVFYIPTYPSEMGINTMAVDEKKNLWMNVHFIYNTCKMDKDRVFGILFHELMHNFFKHQDREEKIYPRKYRTQQHHMKCNICQDFEVNASMVDDGVVPKDFWKKMNGLYNPEYAGKRWEDILRNHGDKEYENWLKLNGMKFSDKTKEALEAIEKALRVIRDPDSTNAEKERAGEILKKKMDELYGKKERKYIDRADLSGLRHELDKLNDSMLGEIDDLASSIQNVTDDLKKHPKDMDEHDIAVTISDVQTLRRDLIKAADKIAETFRKDTDGVKKDVKNAMRSLAEALNVLHDGGVSVKEERKTIRKAKDDLESIILTDVDKKKRAEKREEAIKKHKEKLEKEKKAKTTPVSGKDEKSKKSVEEERLEKIAKLKSRNPIKKFVDTFKNLQELKKVDRISEKSYLAYDDMITILNELVEMNIKDITKKDINGVLDIIPDLRKNSIDDLNSLVKRKILKMSLSDIKSFVNDIFDALEKFFKVLVDEDEPSSVKFGAMSLAVEELRKLGKKLKTQKKIKPSEEWKKSYKETRSRLLKIYKEGGKPALVDELKKMGII